MGRAGLLIGEVAARSHVSRKALRLYEAVGILPPPGRTAAGYRVYGNDALAVLAFVACARRLGFRLSEVKEIVAIKRSGRVPCSHVLQLVRRKIDDVDKVLVDLSAARRGLRALLRSLPGRAGRTAAVCPHIEHLNHLKRGR